MVYNYTKPRGPIAAMYGSPGPCYMLPCLIGQNTHDPRSVHTRRPAYPFGIRHGKFADDCSPGPAHMPQHKVYKDGLDGTPHYSLYGRCRDLMKFNTPGPGAYSPQACGPTAQFRYPAFSMGIRHRDRRTDNTPAPNNYSMPGMLGKTVQSGKRQAPCYSMTGRSKIGSFHEDLKNTPGPGANDIPNPNIYRDKQPLYSMTSRNAMPGDSTQKPGPGAHSPEKVVMNRKKAPNYSFGIRHSEYTAPMIVDAGND